MDGSVYLLYKSAMLLPDATVEIQHCHHTHCAPDWRWEHTSPHPDTLLLWLIQGGEAKLTVDDQTFDLRKGDVFVIPMWKRCLGEHDPRNRLRVPWATFQYVDTCGHSINLSEHEKAWPLHRRIADSVFLEQLFLRAIQTFEDTEQHKSIANQWFTSALLELDRHDRMPRLQGPERELYERIQFICTQIQAHPERPWRVEQLAANNHYSPDHFARLFRKAKGLSPQDFIINARIDAAKSLLHVSSHPIARIADLLGYRDVFHFSKQFKQKTGFTPGAYRKG